MGNNNRKDNKKWIKYLLFGAVLLKIFRIVFMNKKLKKILVNFKDFFKKEKKEAVEFAEGEESLKKYTKDSLAIFKDYFIPCRSNDHKPKILRTRSLAVITVSALLLKIALTAYLFLIYPSIGYMTGKIQDEIFNFINNERKTANVSAVAKNPVLEKAALAKAGDMIGKNYFAHKNPDGKMVWDMISREEYPYLYVGENLAMNFTSANSAHKALMQSPSHKKNILNTRYSEVGIAVANGEINGKQTNVLVQVFAHSNIEKNTAAVSKPAPVKKPQDAKTDSHAISKEEVNKITSHIKQNETENKQPAANIKEDESKVLSAEKDVSKEASAGGNIAMAENADKYLENVKITPINNRKSLDEGMSAAIKEISVESDIGMGETAKIIKISQYIFVAILIFLVIALLANIVIKITIQHKSVIVQTLIVILFIYGLLTIKFHFMEAIAEKIIIS